MQLLTIQVGRPELVMRNEEPVSTAIFKKPVHGKVAVRTLNLDGDRQADLTVHGGPEKAVYGYSSEHYEFWKHELPEMDLPWGMFGENFTTMGLFETEINIGDEYRIGSARLMVTQPRMPCYKLGIRFDRTDILRRFLASERSGFYFSVLEEGEVEPGDKIELLKRDKDNIKVVDIIRLYARDKHNTDLLKHAIAVEALPESWREYFRERLESL